jgi:hypothetical protein
LWFALMHVLLMCFLYVRSDVMWHPRYLSTSTDIKMWPWSLYSCFIGLIFLLMVSTLHLILISKETYIVCKWFSEGEGVLDLSATNINARKAYRPCLADCPVIGHSVLGWYSGKKILCGNPMMWMQSDRIYYVYS